MKRTNNKPMFLIKPRTFDVWHGSKMIGQVTAPDINEAYKQAREHHKIPVAVIGRKEEV